MYEITIDLETTVKGPKNSPEAQYKDNYVVLYGWKINNMSCVVSSKGSDMLTQIESCLDNGHVKIIGHNLKFDLKYLMRERPDIRWDNIEYHDTMFTEYRQSGHQHRFSSLEDSCHRHKLPFTKGLDLGSLIAAGVQIEDIPRSDLEPYLREDVVVTQALYRAQTLAPDYIEYDQSHIAPLAEMELLGLPLDVDKAQDLLADLYVDLDCADKELWELTADQLEWSDGSALDRSHLKFTSARTVCYILTGEPAAGLTHFVRKNIVWRPNVAPLLSKAEIEEVWGDTEPTHLGYPMSKKEIDILATIPSCHHYMGCLLEYRKVNKLIGTYLGPFLEAAEIQPTIHPKMNMCTTATGRLSSSAPNGQNMPEIIRQVFKSENGQFREIDFKQLEVVGLAFQSGDKVLIQDIFDGEDIHYNTGKHVMGWTSPSDMTSSQRKLVKNVNFGLIYGGGAKGLSKQTGQPIKLIKQLISAFYTRYPRVAEWQTEFYTEVTNNLKPNGFKDGEATYCSLVTEPLSTRKFFFKESKSPDWLVAKTGRGYSFKPTETKNYPVQGFAGGDIVMLALTELWKMTEAMEGTQIRMTVHDSILVDTDLSEYTLNRYMDDVCYIIQQRYSLPFNLGFDITSGQYWQ